MSLRDHLTKRPKTYAAFSAVFALIGIAAVIRSSALEPGTPQLKNTYYSDDDGKTFFADRLENLIPFQKRVAPAYRAVVYSCEPGGGRRFVGYLARGTAEDLAAVEQAKEQVKTAEASYAVNDPHVSEAQDALADAFKSASDHLEVKRPGPANHWVSAASAEGQDVVNHVPSPDGAAGTPQVVVP